MVRLFRSLKKASHGDQLRRGSQYDDNVIIDLALSSWTLDPNAVFHRRSPRPLIDRDVNYEDRFDYTTIIYDAFWSEDGSECILICPPFENLTVNPFDGNFRALPSGCPVTPEYLATGPVQIITIAVPPGTTAVELQYSLGLYHIVPQPNLCHVFKGERLLVAHSKDNALHWIRDWAYFHAQQHGCSGVLFYDNGSHQYGKYDLRKAFTDIPGIKKVALIDASFPFGAIKGAGRNDSRYFQRAYLEHAKYRLYMHAKSVLHIDIDELVLSESEESVFAATEQSTTGCLNFEGRWVERVTDDGIEPEISEINHNLFRYVSKNGGRFSVGKCAIASERLGATAIITTHRAYGVNPDYEASKRFKHLHMMGLKTRQTNVKNKERLDEFPFEKANPDKHEIHEALARQLDKAFGSEAYRALPEIPPFADRSDADICRVRAGYALERGDPVLAKSLIEDAIAAEPEAPSYHLFLAKCCDFEGQYAERDAALARADQLLLANPKMAVDKISRMRRAGMVSEALEKLNDLIENAPDHPLVYREHGELLRRTGEREAAEVAFRKACNLDPENPNIMGVWGTHLFRLNRYEEAIDVYTRLIELPRSRFRDLADAYVGRGIANAKIGRFDDASESLDTGEARLSNRYLFDTEVARRFADAHEIVRKERGNH
ncbi:MAG: tetratricopeptide repeat protein [Pseudomonadota bacterium]